MARLRAGDWVLDVDPSLDVLARETCAVEGFVSSRASEFTELLLRRVGHLSPADSFPLSDWGGDSGAYRFDGDTIQVALPDNPTLARRALALGYQTAAVGQGGLLLHGCAVAWGDFGFAAFGPSGAGKSTLARLCARHAGRILSDEVVLLRRDGRVWGTPFWSEPELAGTAEGARLTALFSLAHGGAERVDPVSSMDASTSLSEQVFDFAHRGLKPRALLETVAPLLEVPGVHRLTFANRPEAGSWVKSWCLGRS